VISYWDPDSCWKRGGTFTYCTFCGRRGRTLKWFRRHMARVHL
jgi:hypothetical protein